MAYVFASGTNERRALNAPRQFRLVRTLVAGRQDDGSKVAEIPRRPLALTPEWKNGSAASELRCRCAMTASWFGSLDLPDTRLWRD